MNPKSQTKNFWGFVMSKKYKKHGYAERLKYMHMIENGCSINYIQNKFGQTFYATFENGIETRTSLDESNGNAVLWSFI